MSLKHPKEASGRCDTHHDKAHGSDNDRHDGVEDESAPLSTIRLPPVPFRSFTYNHFHPGIPRLPCSVDWIATCMVETNIEATG
jgi:hypothetical protein